MEDRLARAVAALRHRGPDGSATLVDGGIALGHTRLSIIDVAGGAQPMTSEDGTVIVVYNGEIWNYRELRARLIAAGHSFATECDTEVLVHGYEEWGLALPERLDGMFAYAIWDSRRNRLVLARDRLGKKPLCFVRSDEGLAFGSDARSALLAAGRQIELDETKIPEFLFQRYVTAPSSLYRGVEKLPPGHQLVAESGSVSVTTYWELEPSDAEPIAPQDMRSLLLAAVERRLMSDVPLGALLSGGVDSALVTSLMREAGLSRFPTFTVGFEHQLYDERALARATAQFLETDHYELSVGGDDIRSALPRLLWTRDEPIAEASELPLLLLAEFAARHVKVVLSGDGGDELFGGYPKYRVDRLLQVVPFAAQGARLMGPLTSRTVTHRRLGRAAEVAVIRDDQWRWANWFRSFSSLELDRLLAPRLRPLANPSALSQPLRQAVLGFEAVDGVRRMMTADLKTYLPDNMLTRSDRVLMAASLEGRMPLLDRAIVERVSAAPALQRAGLRTGKKILREVARGLIPADILHAPKKGFTVPIASLILGRDGEFARRVLLSPRSLDRGLFDANRLKEIVSAPIGESSTSELQLFTLVSLELWLRANLDDQPTEPPTLEALVGAASAG